MTTLPLWWWIWSAIAIAASIWLWRYEEKRGGPKFIAGAMIFVYGVGSVIAIVKTVFGI